MRVKATARGHDGLTIREPGDVFEVPDTTKYTPVDKDGKPLRDENGNPKVVEKPVTGSWFKPVEEAEAEAPKTAKGKKAADLA